MGLDEFVDHECRIFAEHQLSAVFQRRLKARALYMFDGNTLFRIHGTNEPNMIGSAASPGCIGTLNSDVRAVML